jgi:hypothetical protein
MSRAQGARRARAHHATPKAEVRVTPPACLAHSLTHSLTHYLTARPVQASAAEARQLERLLTGYVGQEQLMGRLHAEEDALTARVAGVEDLRHRYRTATCTSHHV